MNGLYTILLLVLSNIFMTLAWYGHLKLQQTGVSSNWPLIGVIAFSWAIAFFEYCCQVPYFMTTGAGIPSANALQMKVFLPAWVLNNAYLGVTSSMRSFPL